MESIKAVFGANIKYYRKKQRLSQEQLSEKLGITQKHLSTIETGTNFVSAELLEKFTQQLFVSASALFYSINEVPNDESFLCKIDQIIDNEYEKASNIVKTKIRYLN
ncbi:MAG: helix-turn-helix domain-containing protein [Treponema sp.]|nr:helix-turn-helix domain-containing protein [Treponema sp.]